MCRKYILLLITIFCCVNISNAQKFLKNFSSVGPITKYNNYLLFAADDGVHGNELWKSDGTVAGTVLVKDIAPGAPSSTVSGLTLYNNKVYFSANDGVNGAELWKTDGTAAGTTMVKDINPSRIGNNGSIPANLTVVNGVLVFTGTDSDSTPTSAVFKTDGTAAGTIRLTDLDYFGSGQFTVVKNSIFFTREGNRALWKTDGTIAGTKAVAVDDYYTVDALRAVNDGLVFITNTSYRQNIRLYHLGFNDDKPILLHQYDAVTYGTNDIDNITAVGDGFFYSIRTVDANDNGIDYLWHSDGTPNGTVSIKSFDWKRYLSGSQMQSFVSYNSKLYFAVTSNFALWSSDGTTAGTVKVSDAAVNTSVTPVVSNNRLFYNALGSLWSVDASGTAKSQFSAPNPASLFDLNNTLYFTVKSSNNFVTALWNNVSGPVLAVTADYGTIASGDKMSFSSKVDSAVIKSFTLKNAGNTDLVLSEISVAGTPFYVNGTPAQVIKAGEQATFKLEYLPGKEIQDKGSLLIRSNDSFQGNFVVDLTGSSIGKADIKNQLPGGGLLKYIDFTDTSAVINLSAGTVNENKPKGTVVGAFSVKDSNNAFTYQFINGTGSTDNNSFTIVGNVLKTNSVFKYADKNTYTIRVKASHDTTNHEQVFAISVSQDATVVTAGNCNTVVQNMAYSLNSVDFAGNRIVAVGENGNIIKSDNNGKDWSMANSGTGMSLNKVQFTDDKTGYASYVNNYQSILLKTEDAGDNWFPIDVTDQLVKNSFFVNNNVGYAFTDQASLKSTDGGRSWKKNASIGFSFMNSAYFIDEQTGFVCGSDRTLFRTKNGGGTWARITTVPLGEYTNLFKVIFTSNKTGYIISTAGDVVKTTDGGDNWTRVGVVNDYITDFYFTDDKTGYILAGYGGSIIYKTVDGGITWTNDLQPGFATFFGIKFNKNKTIGVAVGSGQGLGYSGAAGRGIWMKQGTDSWKNISMLPSSDDYYSINFIDNKNGYVFGKYKTAKTTDGGITWTEMPLTGTYGLRHSAFVKNTGYAADLLDMYKTTDAGNSWTKILTGDGPEQIRSVCFVNADTGFYSTYADNGIVAKTTDGGVHWSKTDISKFGFVNNLEFLNSNLGFGVGGQGTIIKTTDGGNSWKRIITDENYWFTSVHIFDENNIIAGGLDGVLLRSKDGGVSWNLIRSTIQQADISHIKFLDKNHGYVFAGNYGNSYGYIYETFDGGENWSYLTSTNDEGSGVDSYGNVVYIAGNGGSVSKIASPEIFSELGYITGETTVAEKIKNQYTVAATAGTNFKWSFTGDAKLTSLGNTATVQWNTPGKYQLQVSAYNNCGQGSVRSLDITVDSTFKSKVTGPDTVFAHSLNVAYNAVLHENSTYSWVVSGDSTTTTTANNAIINWATAGTGKIEVIETQLSTGNKTSAILNVTIKNPPFSLPQTNFKIKAIAESCKGSNNGQIKISADRKLNYTATLQMGNFGKSVSFKDSVSINNLMTGTYHVCISVSGQPDYQQCYDVVIAEPKDLAVYATVNQTDRTVSLALDGGISYNVNLNGTVYTTTAGHITLELAGGSNTVIITTDKECQGAVKQLFVLPQNIVAYPNPFVDRVSLQLNTRNARKATVEVRDMSGKVVYSGSPIIEENKLNLAFGSLNSGVFILKLTLDNKQSVIKIWKK
jgi:ELWxxDGT repeat protein